MLCWAIVFVVTYGSVYLSLHRGKVATWKLHITAQRLTIFSVYIYSFHNPYPIIDVCQKISRVVGILGELKKLISVSAKLLHTRGQTTPQTDHKMSKFWLIYNNFVSSISFLTKLKVQNIEPIKLAYILTSL